VSYGNQLNICRAKADKYGPDWKVIVLCERAEQARAAQEDAEQFLGGHSFKSMRLLKLANGCTVRFGVVESLIDAERVLRGREFTQIVWLRRPKADELCALARSRLRSRAVPAEDWRYEYCTVL
jgi:hypothetical protein